MGRVPSVPCDGPQPHPLLGGGLEYRHQVAVPARETVAAISRRATGLSVSRLSSAPHFRDLSLFLGEAGESDTAIGVWAVVKRNASSWEGKPPDGKCLSLGGRHVGVQPECEEPGSRSRYP